MCPWRLVQPSASIRTAPANTLRHTVFVLAPEASGNSLPINPAAVRKLIQAPRRASTSRYSAVERVDLRNSAGPGYPAPIRTRRGTRITNVPWRPWILRNR